MEPKPTPQEAVVNQREFYKIHLTERRRVTSCIHCNPLPERIPEEFQRLWNWLSNTLNAILVTGHTLISFNKIM